jgi:repressor LexA
MEPLSRRQRDVLSILEEYLQQHGYPPSIREIANRLGLTGTVSVVQHLNALERKGYIRRSKASSRGITLTPDNVDWKQEQLPGVDWENSFFQLPVIATTYPDLQEPDEDEAIELLSLDRFAKTSGTRFAYVVQEDAMRGAGILDGDLTLIQPYRGELSNNQIILAWLNGETLVRRCLNEQGFLRLQPEHPAFDPIFVRHNAAGFHIIGVVTGVFRKTVCQITEQKELS